jgi:dihydroorotase
VNKLVLRGGQIISPADGINNELDILIEDGHIKEIGENLEDCQAQVIDLKGKIVTPGLIDMHVHLREPGFEEKETIRTGTKAAAKGGFTTVACMPNTKPIIDNKAVVESVLTRADKDAIVNLYPIGAISKESRGQELAELNKMREAGIVAISDDGNSVMNAQIMKLALESAYSLELPVIAHCEDDNLAGNGVVNQGKYSEAMGLSPIPSVAEDVMVARDISLAEATGAKLHIAHISTKGAVELVRQAKQRGVNLSCEVAPHHFSLTDQLITSFDTNTKMNPPLRSREDVAAIKEGLQDGTIDVIATDHAPHTELEKNVDYNQAPFGIVGLETALGLVLTELVEPGILTLEEAISKLTINPAQVLGINKGRITVGEVADVTVIDLRDKWRVKLDDLVSKSKNTPFVDVELMGQAVMTIVGGEIVYSSNQ